MDEHNNNRSSVPNITLGADNAKPDSLVQVLRLLGMLYIKKRRRYGISSSIHMLYAITPTAVRIC